MNRKPLKCDKGRKTNHCGNSSTEDLPATLEEFVAEYLENEEGFEDELAFYRKPHSLSEVIELATMAETPEGTKHSHQRRIPPASLAEGAKRLKSNQGKLRAAKDFDALHELVKALVAGIPKFKELTIYDTAHRIGAKLGLSPEFVYLHRGTRKGARELGLDHRADKLCISKLPPALRELTPEQAEDFLCRKKKWLAKFKARTANLEPCRN